MITNALLLFTEIAVTGGAKQNMPALSKLLKITEEENKVNVNKITPPGRV